MWSSNVADTSGLPLIRPPLGPLRVPWLEGVASFQGWICIIKHTLGHFEVCPQLIRYGPRLSTMPCSIELSGFYNQAVVQLWLLTLRKVNKRLETEMQCFCCARRGTWNSKPLASHTKRFKCLKCLPVHQNAWNAWPATSESETNCCYYTSIQETKGLKRLKCLLHCLPATLLAFYIRVWN